jgi:hypothetical protein
MLRQLQHLIKLILVIYLFALLSSLNIVGNIIGSGTALTNLNNSAITNPPTLVYFYSPSTFVSILNISGSTTLKMLQQLIHY